MSVQRDRFVHERLPPRSAWAEMLYPPFAPAGDQPLNLVHELLDKALSRAWADKVLFREPGVTLSYRQVHALVNQRAHA